MIRKMLDKVEPMFKPGGKLEKLYPLYEANDTFLYTPGEVTHGATHVRDALDLKRMMSMVIVALIPCIFMALYNTGYQAQKILAANPNMALPETWWDGAWRFAIMDWLSIDYRSNRGDFLSWSSWIPCLIHGALFFVPVYIVTMAVGGTCEVIFSIIRKHEINEGIFGYGDAVSPHFASDHSPLASCGGDCIWRGDWQGNFRRHRPQFPKPSLDRSGVFVFCTRPANQW
jgi:Na+-transporting NADH:ubiquinone oxidoreductase subunit B